MKRKFTFLAAALALLAFLAIPMGMMGQTRTNYEFNLNELYQDGTLVTAKTVITESGGTLTFTNQNEDFTILMTRNSGYQPGFYTSSGYIRFYNSDTFKLSAADGITMTQITVTPNGTSFSVAAMEGLNTSTKTWTGSASEVTFTGSGTNKWDKLTITYSSGGSQTTTYTVTYNANVAGTAPVVDTYAEGANVTLRDANTFTNDGYTFSEWNTDADGDGDAYEAGDVIEDIQENIELYAIWTENPVSDEQWVLTSLADLTENDVFVIVGNNGENYAMKNTDASNSGPAAIAVTVSGTELSGTVPDNIKWNISGNATDGYIFYPNGSTTTWLYCTNNNNGLRIGSGNTDYNTFEIKASYIYNKGRDRYVGIYNSTDWRSYTSSGGNIANQTFAFYKKVTGEVLPPSITANNVEIDYDATNGSIAYTINNEPTPAGTLTAAVTDGNWLTLGQGTTSPIAFTCTANENTTERTATVTLTYTYNTTETISKEVIVTQGAAPEPVVLYTSIPDLFTGATSTEKSVLVNFGSWIVSGVSTNGKNVYVTDGTFGFVMFYNSDMSETYSAGDILEGEEVSCKLKLYNGYAELLNVNADDLTITPDAAELTPADVEMSELTGMNTGALVHYDNLTCSVENNKYYLSDGSTTLQVYNAIYAFGSTLVADHIYNITGVYQQYTTTSSDTKEILPRSAADIEEVVSTEPTITLDTYEINVDDNSHDDIQIEMTASNMPEDVDYYIEFYDANGNEIEDEDDEPDWLSPIVVDNIVYCYILLNTNTEARTAYFKVAAYVNDEYFVSSDMVTVNQAAAVPGEWVMTSLNDLTENDVFVIVGVYDVDESSYAMPNNSTGAPSAVEVTMVGNTLSGDIDDNLKWNLSIGEDGYTFYPDGETETWLYCTNTNNGVRVGTNQNNVFSMTSEGYLFNNATGRYIGIYNSQDWRCYTSINNNIKEQTFAFYKRVDVSEIETYTLDIDGYGDSDGGYYLIASPVSMIRPTEDNGFLTETYDLYRFDQSASDEKEWRNYEAKHFNIASGQGYLYASKEPTTLTFTGIPYDGDGEVALDYDSDAQFPGYNLIGNPFTTEATLDMPFYRMNEERSGLSAQVEGGSTVNAKEGVFVVAVMDPETGDIASAHFNPGTAKATPNMALNVTRNRGNVIDRAIVRFDEGQQLPKFQLFESSTKLYIPQSNKDFAVVRSANEGEMPVCFKASESGTYTLSINAENVELNYLHLFDNMTGADVDLLATSSYTFEASTTDYANRFRLVFNANNVNENANETFAYNNGSAWVISNQGEATLQVIDVTGRMISSETINGNATINLEQVPGVYMMRLVSGNDVKVQKVIIK